MAPHKATEGTPPPGHPRQEPALPGQRRRAAQTPLPAAQSLMPGRRPRAAQTQSWLPTRRQLHCPSLRRDIPASVGWELQAMSAGHKELARSAGSFDCFSCQLAGHVCSSSLPCIAQAVRCGQEAARHKCSQRPRPASCSTSGCRRVELLSEHCADCRNQTRSMHRLTSHHTVIVDTGSLLGSCLDAGQRACRLGPHQGRRAQGWRSQRRCQPGRSRCRLQTRSRLLHVSTNLQAQHQGSGGHQTAAQVVKISQG